MSTRANTGAMTAAPKSSDEDNDTLTIKAYPDVTVLYLSLLSL